VTTDEGEAPAGVPIPPELFSTHDDAPFRLCSDCGGELSAAGSPHVIGKSWRDGEVVFEFALCMRCALVLFSQYSEESKRNLEDYFRTVHENRRSGLSTCARCGREGAELLREKNVEALAASAALLDEPIVVCGPCSDGADRVLSEKTRESLDDFMRRVCPTLPADIDLPAPIFSIP
jgi:hypothetical protein